VYRSSPKPRSPIVRLAVGLVAAAVGIGIGLGGYGLPSAQAAGAFFCADGTQPYAPVSTVEAFAAGTAVTGLSVTSGTTPSAFTGSYVGSIANGLGVGKDLLLFRLRSDVIDGTGPNGLKAAGIWAGMSGSPVYATDGSLIGAVAYSLNEDNLPIAGVTPAEYMKSIGNTALGTAAKVKSTASNLVVSDAGARIAGTNLAGTTFTRVKNVNVAGTAEAKANAFVNRTLARTPRTAKAAGTLRSRTFAPAAAQTAAVTAPLVAGGSIAALYTSGDLISGSIGTVTAVCGNTVYAFGHPMDLIGTTSLAMANASTALIVPDGTGTVGSYKQVSQIGEPLGMITQDRLVGIRGTVGSTTTYGIDVRVRNASGTQVATYHSDIAYPEVAASAVAALTGQAAYEQLDQYSSGTGKVSWTIHYRRASGRTESLTNSQIVSDPADFPDAVATYPADDLWTISDNALEKVTITGVEVTLTLLDADGLSYQASGVQLRRSTGRWGSLDGARLKAGKTYSIRPTYTLRTNGVATTTVVTGNPLTIKLPAKARKSGWFSAVAAAEYVDVCDDSIDECDDWADEGDLFSSFDDLIASLQDETSNSSMSGELHYRLTKGSRTRARSWHGPGVVTGGVQVAFQIKK